MTTLSKALSVPQKNVNIGFTENLIKFLKFQISVSRKMNNF